MNALAVIDTADQPIQLEVFSYVPTWARVHAVGDKNAMPLFRQGEVAVYENCPKRIPEHGKLYVVEYGGNPIAPGHSILTPRSMHLVQAYRRQRTDQEFWSFRSYAGPAHWHDGWYADEYAMALKVLGPVVGIYAPSGSVRP